MLLTATACSFEKGLEEPPRLTVILGEQQISASQISCGWTYKNTDMIADGVHPLQFDKEPVQTAETVAVLRFGAEPQRTGRSRASKRTARTHYSY